ncbi:MAG: hypothetical protein Q8O67_33605 [Deltaproteobacteria bacterium]|nr:hypothetical protein [Deltaproteobacteria bacterium]
MQTVPPPPKSSSPAGQASGTPAEEAERLGREHSNKRELKMRQERVRALADDSKTPQPPRARPPAGSGGTGVPGVPGAPVVQPRKTSVAESRVPDVDDRAPPGRTPAAPRPAQSAERERIPDRPKVVTKPLPPPPAEPTQPGPSVIDDVAVEAEELMREGGNVWGRFTVADKITFICAILTGMGTLLPWLYRKNEELVLGVGCGGIVHAVVAVTAMALLIRRELPIVDDRGLRPSPNQQRRRARRTALLLLLLALVSTVAGTWFLLVYGAVRRFAVSDLEVSVGLYVTLAAGLGLSYSGFAYFWRGGDRAD